MPYASFSQANKVTSLAMQLSCTTSQEHFLKLYLFSRNQSNFVHAGLLAADSKETHFSDQHDDWTT